MHAGKKYLQVNLRQQVRPRGQGLAYLHKRGPQLRQGLAELPSTQLGILLELPQGVILQRTRGIYPPCAVQPWLALYSAVMHSARRLLGQEV